MRTQFQHAHFCEISDEELREFTGILHSSLRRLHTTLGEPDYNLVLATAPQKTWRPMVAYNVDKFYSWHAILIPRLGLGAMAGFEFGSGIFSNANLPEDDAQTLRDAVWDPQQSRA